MKKTLVNKSLFNGELTAAEIYLMSEILLEQKDSNWIYFQYTFESPLVELSVDKLARINWVRSVIIDLEKKKYIKIIKWHGFYHVSLKLLKYSKMVLDSKNSLRVDSWAEDVYFSGKEIVNSYIEDVVESQGKMKISNTAFLFYGGIKEEVESSPGYFVYDDDKPKPLSEEEYSSGIYDHGVYDHKYFSDKYKGYKFREVGMPY